jgi:hypothetical protein
MQILRFCIANFSIYFLNKRKKLLHFDPVSDKIPGTHDKAAVEDGVFRLNPSISAELPMVRSNEQVMHNYSSQNA